MKLGVFVYTNASFVSDGTSTLQFSVFDNTNGFLSIRAEQLTYSLTHRCFRKCCNSIFV